MMAPDLDFQRDAVLADLRARLRRCTHAKLTCTVLVEDGGIVEHRIVEEPMTDGDWDRLMRAKPRKIVMREHRGRGL
jgi:hypothetical protein